MTSRILLSIVETETELNLNASSVALHIPKAYKVNKLAVMSFFYFCLFVCAFLLYLHGVMTSAIFVCHSHIFAYIGCFSVAETYYDRHSIATYSPFICRKYVINSAWRNI